MKRLRREEEDIVSPTSPQTRFHQGHDNVTPRANYNIHREGEYTPGNPRP
jgi:hypothetical protein